MVSIHSFFMVTASALLALLIPTLARCQILRTDSDSLLRSHRFYGSLCAIVFLFIFACLAYLFFKPLPDRLPTLVLHCILTIEPARWWTLASALVKRGGKELTALGRGGLVELRGEPIGPKLAPFQQSCLDLPGAVTNSTVDIFVLRSIIRQLRPTGCACRG
jgi:hypothetical protein